MSNTTISPQEAADHLSGNATIRPSGEKPVLTRPSPPASDVSRAGRSSKGQLPISPVPAPQ
jgi:hypothetical protein